MTLLAKAHQKVRRQRQDFHHKMVLALVQANGTIYHEDLQRANRSVRVLYCVYVLITEEHGGLTSGVGADDQGSVETPLTIC